MKKESNDTLDAFFAKLPPMPAHLRPDASFLQCSKCGRKSWGGDAVNSICGMPSPTGKKCDGIFEGRKA
jgi:hypothetical protein